MRLGRQQGDDLLAQLRELLLPSSSAAAPVKVEPGGPPLGAGPPPAPSSCDGRRRQRRRRGSKRGRDDDKTTSGSEEHDVPAAAAQPPRHLSCKRRKTKQQKSSSSLVTSEPDFDGYQWRKYGQKQIEGAMYARSYYRCTRSAEQGCPAKRTVQRNDDDGGGGAAPDPKYTVTYMGEHTCTADDSLEVPPVILETTAVVPAATSTNNKSRLQDDAPTTSAGSCSTTGAGTESPAISDITRSSSSDHVDEYCGLFAVHDSWPSAAALQEMVEDFTGPIRSPVHIPAAGWTIDQFLLQLPDEPVCHFSF